MSCKVSISKHEMLFGPEVTWKKGLVGAREWVQRVGQMWAGSGPWLVLTSPWPVWKEGLPSTSCLRPQAWSACGRAHSFLPPGVYSSLSDSLALSLLFLSLSPRGEAWRGRAQGLSLGWADPPPAPDRSVLWASGTEPWCDRWGTRQLGPGAPADSPCDRPWSTPAPLEDPLYAWHPNQARLGPAHLELKARPERCSIQVLHTLAAYNS